MVRLADPIRAPDTEMLGALIATRTPVVAPHADLPEIAGVMTDYDFLSLPRGGSGANRPDRVGNRRLLAERHEFRVHDPPALSGL
jgi:hypothetical protein